MNRNVTIVVVILVLVVIAAYLVWIKNRFQPTITSPQTSVEASLMPSPTLSPSPEASATASPSATPRVQRGATGSGTTR